MNISKPGRREVLGALLSTASLAFCSLGKASVRAIQATRAISEFHEARMLQYPRKSRAYHDAPPKEPVPQTIDPSVFTKNRSSFVAYSLAGQIKELLYQEPCYCPCDEEEGHESLLDCFTTQHGASCEMCKLEVIFCFEQQRKGRSAHEIRKSMTKREWSKIDLRNSTDKYYALLQRGTP